MQQDRWKEHPGGDCFWRGNIVAFYNHSVESHVNIWCEKKKKKSVHPCIEKVQKALLLEMWDAFIILTHNDLTHNKL